METEKYYFRVGVFFLVAATAFVYYIISFGGGPESHRLTRYAIYFDGSVSGLTRGAPVKLQGIAVGLVNDLRFVSRENGRILVLADISDTAPIRKDTIASVSFQGITGTTFLSLENTKPDEPPVYLEKKEGEKYPVIQSEHSDLQTAEMMGSITKTSGQMQKLLSDKNISGVQEIIAESHNVLAEATGALREIKMLARTVRDDPSIILRGSKHEGYKTQK
jgi:phospholipid/cholesterol/gamma-HCH transport system substrate-binding protein